MRPLFGGRTAADALRAKLIAGLLIPGCPQCPAPPGAWCDPHAPPPRWMSRIDRDPPRFLCNARVVLAARSGHVNRKLLVAQYDGGTLPDGL